MIANKLITEEQHELLMGYDCKRCNMVHISTVTWKQEENDGTVSYAAMLKATKEEMRENLWTLVLREFMRSHVGITFDTDCVTEDQERLGRIRIQQMVTEYFPVKRRRDRF